MAKEKLEKEEVKEEVVYKKSELIARQKELLELNDKLVKELQEREYVINFQNRPVFNRLIKFLENDAPWGHTTATGLIMLFNNLMEQKKKLKTESDWSGEVKLRAAGISILWSMVTKMQGTGFHQAKNFVELMANCGESLSKAVQQSNTDNQKLRENHQQLSELDNLFSSPNVIDDITDENESEEKLTLEQEVNPEV